MLETLRQWLRPASLPDGARWVVLDVESSGLRPRQDRLLAIAAVAVHLGPDRPAIALGDSFEVVLRQRAQAVVPDKANILIHHIGVGAQQGGIDPAAALQAFDAYVGRSPLIAFHAAFDRAMIERACRLTLGRVPRHAWLDLEPLAAVLHPQVRARSLDEWMAHFQLRCAVRHQAAADTLVTAELLLKLWPALRAQLPRPAFSAVAALAAQRRWVQS